MFREIRFQTGEVLEVSQEMKKGSVPCLELQFEEEFEAFVIRLKEYGIYFAENIPLDKDARDRIKEREFEYRAAFTEQPAIIAGEKNARLMYIDVFVEEVPEETYDPVGEM